MIRIKNTVISEDLISEDFVCNLSSCKGSCCVEGEAGAPLNENEVLYLQKNYSKIKPFLNPKGKKSIESQGVFVKGIDGEYETPLVDGKECSYAVFSENEIISCGIENAYNEGKIDYKGDPSKEYLIESKTMQYRFIFCNSISAVSDFYYFLNSTWKRTL